MKQRSAFALIMGMITTVIISFAMASIMVSFMVAGFFLILFITPWVQFLVNSLFREKFTAKKDQ